MVIDFNGFYHRFSDRISKGLQELQKTFIKKFRHQERILSISSLVLALCFGNCAQNASEREALRRWERSHIPSDKVFEYSVGSQGWRLMVQSKVVEKLIRGTPATIDEKGAVWVNENWNWILFYSGSSETVQAQFY